MDDIEYLIRTILDPNTNLQIYDNGVGVSLTAYALDLTLCLFPDSVGIKKPISLAEIREALIRGIGAQDVGIDKYFIYFDKDEHFNHEVNGEKVLPFELNDLVPQLFELANKLIVNYKENLNV